MALIRCKECQKEISDSAKICPSCGHKNQQSRKTILLVGIFGAVFFYMAFAPTTQTNELKKQTIKENKQEKSNISQMHKWETSSDVDKMNGKSILSASVSSLNKIDLGWPYGTVSGHLIIRKHPRYGNDVIFNVDKGHIPCRSYSPCAVLIRFDDKPPSEFQGNGPSDGSTEYIFIHGFDRFVKLTTKAKTARLAVTFYKKGAPEFVFDVSNFPADFFTVKNKK